MKPCCHKILKNQTEFLQSLQSELR